jgi:hypothetical protein
MKTFNVSQFYNGFYCYFESTFFKPCLRIQMEKKGVSISNHLKVITISFGKGVAKFLPTSYNFKSSLK